MTLEQRRNLRAMVVVILLAIVAVVGVTLMVSAAYGAKRYKMSAGMALRIAEDRALHWALSEQISESYGAYGCERWNPYAVHCIEWVTFLDGKVCTRLVNITNSRKNYIRVKQFPPFCR